MAGLRQYWATSFPPLATAVASTWLAGLGAHGQHLRLPGRRRGGASTATFIAFAAGAVVLARRGQGAIVACLIAPFGLAFLAAALGRYPYGSEARLMQFAAPEHLSSGRTGSGRRGGIDRQCLRVRRSVIWVGLSGLVACGIVVPGCQFLAPVSHVVRPPSSASSRARSGLKKPEAPQLTCAHLDYGIDQAGRLARPAGLVSLQPDDLLAGSTREGHDAARPQPIADSLPADLHDLPAALRGLRRIRRKPRRAGMAGPDGRTA